MQEFTYTKAHNLAQLNDELLSAIPALVPKGSDDPEASDAKQAVHRTEGRQSDGFIRIVVPEGVRKSDVDRVVEAHVADPMYGVDVPPTVGEFLVMNETAQLTFIAKRIGLKD